MNSSIEFSGQGRIIQRDIASDMFGPTAAMMLWRACSMGKTFSLRHLGTGVRVSVTMTKKGLAL